MKFFLNCQTTSYLRDLSAEFGESTNAIRLELNRLEEAGLLDSKMSGNKKIYQANRRHPLFKDIHNILMKHTGIDHIISKVIRGLGGLHSAYVVGSFARGKDNPVIDLLLVGQHIDRAYLVKLVEKAENIIMRKISYMVIGIGELQEYIRRHPEALLLWQQPENRPE